jgi:hypothetical protein
MYPELQVRDPYQIATSQVTQTLWRGLWDRKPKYLFLNESQAMVLGNLKTR